MPLSSRASRLRAVAAAGAVLLGLGGVAAVASAQIPGVRLPRVPGGGGGLRLPNLDAALKGDPPLTTSLRDACPGVSYLDDLRPRSARPLSTLERTPAGGFRLKPGYYKGTFQSYCLRAGTPQPTGGLGFLYGDYKGPKAQIVETILKNADAHPQIPQRDIQVLLWAIMARAKYSELSQRTKLVAATLLQPQQIALLQSEMIEELPERLFDRAFGKFDREVRKVFESEARMRNAFRRRTGVSYEDLERLAVPRSDGPLRTTIPPNRWSYHRNGYFFRCDPTSYKQMTFEVYVPRASKITRDALGRISRWEDADGWAVETTYASKVPFTSPKMPGVKAYRFATIRFVSPDPAAPGKLRERIVKNKGWTFVGRPEGRTRRRTASAPSVYRDAHAAGTLQEYDVPVIDVTPAVERYEQAQDTWDTVNDLMDWFNFDRSDQQSDQAYNDLTDTDHYREGVETAVTGSEEDRLNWIAETFDRMGDALAHATDLLNTLPDGREGEGEFDPSDGLYVPGNTGAQRLGGSSRFF